MKNFINFFKGEESYAASFWFYFVTINLLFILILKALSNSWSFPLWLMLLLYMFHVSYGFFSIVGTWRASMKFKKKLHATIGQYILVFYFIRLCFQLYLLYPAVIGSL